MWLYFVTGKHPHRGPAVHKELDIMKTYLVTIKEYEFEIKASADVNIYIGTGGDDPSETLIENLTLHNVDEALAEVASYNPDEDAYHDGIYWVNGSPFFTRDEFVKAALAQVEAKIRD